MEGLLATTNDQNRVLRWRQYRWHAVVKDAEKLEKFNGSLNRFAHNPAGLGRTPLSFHGFSQSFPTPGSEGAHHSVMGWS